MAKNKIKVLYVSEDFFYIGGVERYLWYLANNLDREKFEPCFCCIGGKEGPMGRKIEKLGFPIYALNHQVLYGHLDSFLDLGVIFKLRKLIKNYQPDIVQTWDIDGNYLGRIASIHAGIPILIATEVTRWDQRNGFRSKVRAKILSLSNLILDRLTDIIVVDSRDIKRFRNSKVTLHKVRLIYQPFDSERFLKVGSRYGELRRRNQDEFVLGIVARLDIQKGHRYLLEAMPEILEKFPMAKLLIIGKGPLEESLKEQARSLGISDSVIFKGEIVDEVPEVMCSIDVFVHPSLYEGGGPTSVLEAMAIGLPVVASDIGGMNESVVNSETGILVPPKDSHALAKAIIQLLSNKALAREMGLKGRERVSSERFQLATYIKTIENLYQELMVEKDLSISRGS